MWPKVRKNVTLTLGRNLTTILVLWCS